MFTKLALNQRFTGCPYCNSQGCVWEREKNATLGHAIWTLKFTIRNFKKFVHYQFEKLTALDYRHISDIEVDGIHSWDAPDFCDAYIASATYKGRPMTDKELDRLNQDSGFVYEAVVNRLY